jgi:hypothetical protein
MMNEVGGLPMFKKKIFLSCLAFVILLIAIFIVAFINGRKDVPKLSVTYNGTKIEVGQGPYSWNSRGKLKEFAVDSYGSVISTLLNRGKVEPNGQLQLIFDYQPETITLDGGVNVSDYGKVLKGNIINLSEYRTGLYFLDCKWQEGTVTFIVFVDIQK